MDKQYYVYRHRDPVTKKCVYIGVGTKGRAWTTESCHRSPEHRAWMLNLLSLGYTPADWVIVILQGLSKTEALAVEKSILISEDLVFNNYNYGESHPNAILTRDQAIEIYHRAWSGNETQKQIGDEYGVTRRTVCDIKYKRRRQKDLFGISPNET